MFAAALDANYVSALSKSYNPSDHQPTELINGIGIIYILQSLHLIQAIRLRGLLTSVESKRLLSDQLEGIIAVFTLCGTICIVAHLCACIFHFIALNMTTCIDDNPFNYVSTWIHEAKLDESSWQTRYIASLYWATTTMITVGYGDITPRNNAERIFSMFVMYVASGTFAYTMNTISTVFKIFGRSSQIYETRIGNVNRYMLSRGFSAELQLKIRNYLEFIWKKSSNEETDEYDFMNSLTKVMRDEATKQIFGSALKSCVFCRRISRES